MKGLPLGPGAEDITWPHQVAPWGRRAPGNGNIKPQTSNLPAPGVCPRPADAPLPPPSRTPTQPRSRVRIHAATCLRTPAPRLLPEDPQGTGLRGLPQAHRRR